MSHYNAFSIFFTLMRETSNRTIKLAFVKNINTISSRYSIVINKDNDIEIRNMFKNN